MQTSGSSFLIAVIALVRKAKWAVDRRTAGSCLEKYSKSYASNVPPPGRCCSICQVAVSRAGMWILQVLS